MRIVVDLQGAQSASRNRGIGRYSLALAQALARNRGRHDVVLALSGLFPETIGPIREAFKDLLPRENITVWTAPAPVAFLDPANEGRRDAAECLREAFLASLEPDIVLVTSLFEGLDDDAVGSVGRQAHLPTAVVLYDLIPLIYRQIYLGDPTVERWYMEKLAHLKRADLLLAISASSGREAVERLGFAEDRVANISAACEPHFLPRAVTQDLRRSLRSAYGIEHPFVMYTGGIDHRKNIEGLIRAYARLPAKLRSAHQLVVVCAAQAPDRERLLELAGAAGLAQGELVLTGYVPDGELVTLYNACKLFVFPSWHEGFGLPALEAMQCGRAVIAANTSSLPEVIGRSDALFDPRAEADMAAKLGQVLQDEGFRQVLERHGLEQARQFSWDTTARRALASMERLHADRLRSMAPAGLRESQPENRPLLAYVSPLPPERSGIADYSAELLRELARWYEVEVIVDQDAVADEWIVRNCAVRDVAWFRAHHRRYERVLYHFGNSTFHQHMFDLLEDIPGIVVLHDFFLSGILAHREWAGSAPRTWGRALLASHGYRTLRERYIAPDIADVIWAYPCNLPVLQQSLGVIVHSEHSRALTEAWYGEEVARDWSVIPLLRTPAGTASRLAARRSLKLRQDDFLICSFGLIAPTKCSLRLFDAFAQSPLAQDPAVRLVFVGENHGGDYGSQLLDRIRAGGLNRNVSITGWADAETYKQYLAAADLAVQLRTLSRGETSAAVLDCMNHGLATVVNAHGSLAELDPQAVHMLPDAFADSALAEALTALRRDAGRRLTLGQQAQAVIRSRHAPAACAAQYAKAIEELYRKAGQGVHGLLHRWADDEPAGVELTQLARALALDFPPRPRRRQVLVDVSALAQVDLGTGIERAVRAILREWLLHPPAGWSVEPVYATADAPGYRYARRFASRFLGIDEAWAEDAPMDAWAGDVFVGLDLAFPLVPQHEPFFSGLRTRGIAVLFVVYDLLPVLRPDCYPDGMESHFTAWLRTLARVADGLIGISRAVAEELRDWLDAEQPQPQRPLRLGYFHLGADVDNGTPHAGLPHDANEVLKLLRVRRTFLMVGTVEPRKGHVQTLAAFERLWAQGHDVNLAIVGKQGWMMEALVERLRQHPEAGRRLFWLQDISDDYLERIYAASTCLIAASEAEGFGLPLIEGARHGLPIIARDIPVFREVTDGHAFYFRGDKPEDLADALVQWLSLHADGNAPKSSGMRWSTWKQSAKTLETLLMDEGHPQWIHA
jgi:glycosyltransferase involved in cell wall biosynthesis